MRSCFVPLNPLISTGVQYTKNKTNPQGNYSFKSKIPFSIALAGFLRYPASFKILRTIDEGLKNVFIFEKYCYRSPRRPSPTQSSTRRKRENTVEETAEWPARNEPAKSIKNKPAGCCLFMVIYPPAKMSVFCKTNTHCLILQ